MGVSRDTFYRYRELADEGGVDALINLNRRAPNLQNRTDEATERENFHKRLKALEEKVARDGIELTASQIAALPFPDSS